MEMIYDGKNGEIKLPENVKTFGMDEGTHKVYIEDYAFSFAKGIHIDEDEFGAVGVLLGERIKREGETYVFVKGAAKVINAAVFSDKIAFTEETWPVVRNMVFQHFGGLDIVGWFLVSDQYNVDQLDIVADAHEASFKDEDDIVLIIDRTASTEEFYAMKEGELSKLLGYNVYFDRNEKMQAYMETYFEEHPDDRSSSDYGVEQINLNEEESETRPINEGGRYRKMMAAKKSEKKSEKKVDKEPANGKVSKEVRSHLTLIYALSVILVTVLLVFGISAINKSDVKKTSAPTKAAQATTAKPTVETVNGNVTTEESTTEESTTEAPTTEAPTTEAPTTEAPTTEAPTTVAPTVAPTVEYTEYTIQQGDSFYKICVNFYGKWDKADMERIKQLNGMSASQTLLPGKTIKIPKK